MMKKISRIFKHGLKRQNQSILREDGKKKHRATKINADPNLVSRIRS